MGTQDEVWSAGIGRIRLRRRARRRPDALDGPWDAANKNAYTTDIEPGIYDARVQNPIVRLAGNPHLTLVSRLVLGGILVVSGLTKLGVPSTVSATVNSYELGLPSGLVQAIAWGLPVLELGLGVWLLAGLFTRFAAGVSVGLMLLFIAAIGQAWARGIEADCGCFAGAEGTTTFAEQVMAALGPVGAFLSDAQIGPVPLSRDALFLLMALHLFFVPTVWGLDQLRRKAAGY